MRPLFTKDPVMKQTGNKVVMEALVKSDPQARVRWYHHSPDDENLMQDSERYRMKSQENKDGTQVFTLTITAPTLEDSGTYLVKAYNALGENSAKFNLNLGVPEGEGVIPEFLGPPSITDSPDRKAMTIECQVKGDPKPTASWIFDDKTLSDVKEKYKMPVVELGDNKWALRLTIFNTEKTDTGRYKCTAKNKYGSCHGSVSVQM